MITDNEAIELSMLLGLRDTKRAMSKKRYMRMRELKDKMNHNACLNAACRGYQGKDWETHCPICEKELFKNR